MSALWALPPELLLLGIVLALCLFAGVPAIRYGIWLPRELELQVLPDDELSEVQLDHYRRLDEALQDTGYRPRLNFTVLNMQGPTLSRVYWADHDPALLGAHCLRSQGAFYEHRPTAQNYMEWITKYEDGTVLSTRNAEITELFDPMPHQLRQECVGLIDPLALKARHDRKARELLARGPVWAHARDVLEEFRAFHVRFCAFQESRGLLVRDGELRLRPTVRTALRGVATFLNPLADNFTLGRFALGLLLGMGLPVLATWLTTPSAEWRPAGFPLLALTPVGRLVLLAAVYTAAGAAVGWIFHLKAFLWAALFGYLPLRLLTASPWSLLLLALWMGQVADWTGQLRNRREMLF